MMQELSPEQLTKRIDFEQFGIESTKGLDRLKGIIGQERAVRALRFGLQMQGIGYNIYVSGPPGTGKRYRNSDRFDCR